MTHRARSPTDEALRFGTEAHYADARLYDHVYARRTHDVRFYVSIADEIGGPVLELGAGSGRVSLPVARAGHRIVAVDRMPSMLARMRERLAREPRRVRDRVTIVRADLRRVRLGQRFPLVIAPFNVVMHLYRRRDVEAALATCRVHLSPRGRLVFDVLMPDLRALLRDPERHYRARPITDPRGRRWAYGERFQYDPASQIQTVTAVLQSMDDPDDVRVMPLAHRQFFPAELEAILHYNGFAIEHHWGDFERGPLAVDGQTQVIVARRRTR